VIIATPDHWHALQAIAAVEAGAHVFVEKPAGHTIKEGRAMVNAAQRTGRVVQVGLHRRIGPHHVSGMEFLKSGKVGEIGMVRMVVTGAADGPEKPSENCAVPPELDWDFYCGPAPLRPFPRASTQESSAITSISPTAPWAIGAFTGSIKCSGGATRSGPRAFTAPAGVLSSALAVLTEKEQTTDAPDHQVATYEFTGFTAVWEHRRFGGLGTDASPFGTTFYGSNGTFHMGWRDGWTFYPNKKGGATVHEDPKFDNEKDGHNVPPLARFPRCDRDRPQTSGGHRDRASFDKSCLTRNDQRQGWPLHLVGWGQRRDSRRSGSQRPAPAGLPGAVGVSGLERREEFLK